MRLLDDGDGVGHRPSDEGEYQHAMGLILSQVRKVEEMIGGSKVTGITSGQIKSPIICVVGDQSSGKSSIIESLFGVKLPRGQGTCTHCPIQINFWNTKEPQEFEVWLSHSSAPSTDKETREDVCFTKLDSMDQVPDAIKSAECAMLNSDKDWIEFVSPCSTPFHNYKRPYSNGLIRLEVPLPGFPSLTVFDLPPVVNWTENKEDGEVVTVYQRTVKHFVSQENCIVLLALAMTNRPSNCSAARVIREGQGDCSYIGRSNKT